MCRENVFVNSENMISEFSRNEWQMKSGAKLMWENCYRPEPTRTTEPSGLKESPIRMANKRKRKKKKKTRERKQYVAHVVRSMSSNDLCDMKPNCDDCDSTILHSFSTSFRFVFSSFCSHFRLIFLRCGKYRLSFNGVLIEVASGEL